MTHTLDAESKTFTEGGSLWLIQRIDGLRFITALFVTTALCLTSMGINFYYGWGLGDSSTLFRGYAITCILLGCMVASLDAGMFYLAKMTPIIAKHYGWGWYLTYFLVALLLCQTVFTAVAVFSTVEQVKEENKLSEVDSALISVATSTGKASADAMTVWNDKLGKTDIHTTSWNKQREIEAARADKSISVLSNLRESKVNKVDSSKAVFVKYDLKWLEKNIRPIFSSLFAITGLFVSVFLKLDANITQRRYIKIETVSGETEDKSLTAKEKPKNRKKTDAIETAKLHPKYKKAVQLSEQHGFGDYPSIRTVHTQLKPIAKDKVGDIMRALADDGLIKKQGQKYIYAKEKRGLFSVK